MSTNPFVPLYGPLYGSVYFSTVLTTAFYGVTCMQAFFYYVHYQNDPLRTKSLVAVIWALNTIHEALIVSGAYKYIMAGLRDPSAVFDGTTELIALPTTLVAVAAQGFLVHRIYIFSGKNIVAPLIWLILGILQLVFVTIYLGKALYSANGVQAVDNTMLGRNPLVTLATVCLSIAAGEDVLIAIFMTLLLVRERGVTPFPRTAHILQRLTVFAVNTGIWTAAFALLSLISMDVFSFPSNILFIVFFVPLCPLYCNTLLANLNVRVYIGGATTDWFSNSSLPVSDTTTKPNEQRGGAGLVFSPQETTEVVTFLDASQSTTESANA